MTTENRWARKPNERSREALKSHGGSRRNYWVIGRDGKRRGPASLDRDGVKRQFERGAQDVIPLAPGEYWTTELRNNT